MHINVMDNIDDLDQLTADPEFSDIDVGNIDIEDFDNAYDDQGLAGYLNVASITPSHTSTDLGTSRDVPCSAAVFCTCRSSTEVLDDSIGPRYLQTIGSQEEHDGRVRSNSWSSSSLIQRQDVNAGKCAGAIPVSHQRLIDRDNSAPLPHRLRSSSAA